MSTIPDLVATMQDEYPNLYILDEDTFEGKPALTYTDDNYMVAYTTKNDLSYIFFEEYDFGEDYTAATDEIEDASEFYQFLANFMGWLVKETPLSKEVKTSIKDNILKSLKKYGHAPELDWSLEDYS